MKLKFNGQTIEIPTNTVIDLELDRETSGSIGPFFRLSGLTFDMFECDTGSLGITVYTPDRDPNDDEASCVDIYVDKNLKVRSV